jgi:anti-sigma regulatory factor (Ser/Thr protein kinase)
VTANGDRFALELPNDPAFVATARLFASSLARHFEIDENIVEDLKLAISEACKRALAAKDEHRRLSVSAAKDNGRLVFEIPQGDLPPPVQEDTPTPSNQQMAAGLSLELISALFDDAEMATDAEGLPVVRFSVSS